MKPMRLDSIQINALLVAFNETQHIRKGEKKDLVSYTRAMKSLITALNWITKGEGTVTLVGDGMTIAIPLADGGVLHSNYAHGCECGRGYCWHRAAAQMLHRCLLTHAYELTELQAAYKKKKDPSQFVAHLIRVLVQKGVPYEIAAAHVKQEFGVKPVDFPLVQAA